MVDIVKLAPGEKILMGLSGGGGAALYTGMTATNTDGTALFSKQLLVAPYLDVAIIGPALGPIEAMGLGEVKVDFGASCRGRRGLGKRGKPASGSSSTQHSALSTHHLSLLTTGYCNYKFNRIGAMRQVAQDALADLAILPSTSIEVVLVQGDGTVTNKDIVELADRLDTLAAGDSTKESSRCMLGHVDARHSPLSIWNYMHQVGDEELEWVPELVCQFTDFLVAGTAMPTAGTIEDGDPPASLPQCATACPGACSYSCANDTYLTCGA